MSSYQNADTPDMAMDGDNSTCATFGYESNSFWKRKLVPRQIINSVTVYGTYTTRA